MDSRPSPLCHSETAYEYDPQLFVLDPYDPFFTQPPPIYIDQAIADGVCERRVDPVAGYATRNIYEIFGMEPPSKRRPE